jgi:hypothetical protein
MPAGPPDLKCIKKKFGEIFIFFNLNFLFFLYPKFFLVHFKYGGPAVLEMYQENFDFEWLLIDVIYKGLASFRYLGLE